MENQIDILYYEDHSHLRDGLSFYISTVPGLHLQGAMENCANLANDILIHKPDVVILDIDMPGMTGIEAIPIIKNLGPSIQVLMLTVFEEEDKIFAAIRNGADGYLLKSASPAEIVEAIEIVYSGGSLLTPSIARKVIGYFQAPMKKIDFELSAREIQILQGLVKGYSYKIIGYDLDIKIDTVRSHIRNIYDKLQVNSKTEAILKALNNNLVTLAK